MIYWIMESIYGPPLNFSYKTFTSIRYLVQTVLFGKIPYELLYTVYCLLLRYINYTFSLAKMTFIQIRNFSQYHFNWWYHKMTIAETYPYRFGILYTISCIHRILRWTSFFDSKCTACTIVLKSQTYSL